MSVFNEGERGFEARVITPNPKWPAVLRAKTSKEHQARAGEFLSQMRHKRQEWAADVELQLERGKDFVHSAVMAAHSGLLQRILEREQPPLTLDLTKYNLHPEALRKAIDFMYDGKVSTAPDSIGPLLYAAIVLEINQLQSLLETHIVQQVALMSDGLIPSLNICFDLPVSSETRRRLLSNAAVQFSRLRKQLDKLDGKAFCHLIAEDGLSVESEFTVFEAVVDWLTSPNTRSTPNGRLSWAGRLLDGVRFDWMSTEQKIKCSEVARAKGLNLDSILQWRLADGKTKLIQPQRKDQNPLMSAPSETYRQSTTRPEQQRKSPSQNQSKLLSTRDSKVYRTFVPKRNPEISNDIYGRAKLQEDSVSWAQDDCQSTYEIRAYPSLPFVAQKDKSAEQLSDRDFSWSEGMGAQTDANKKVIVLDSEEKMARSAKQRDVKPMQRRPRHIDSRQRATTALDVGGRPLASEDVFASLDPKSRLLELPESTEPFLGGFSPRQTAQTQDRYGRSVVHELSRKESSTKGELDQYRDLPFTAAGVAHRREDGRPAAADGTRFCSESALDLARYPDLPLEREQSNHPVAQQLSQQLSQIQISQYQHLPLEKAAIEAYVGPKQTRSEYCFDREAMQVPSEVFDTGDIYKTLIASQVSLS